MKPRFFFFVLALAAMFALRWVSPAKTVAGGLTLNLTITTNQADGLDWAAAKFNASQLALSTNWVALTASQYINARVGNILDSYYAASLQERLASNQTAFINAPESKRIAAENALK